MPLPPVVAPGGWWLVKFRAPRLGGCPVGWRLVCGEVGVDESGADSGQCFPLFVAGDATDVTLG